jgi:hypothetical protein
LRAKGWWFERVRSWLDTEPRAVATGSYVQVPFGLFYGVSGSIRSLALAVL